MSGYGMDDPDLVYNQGGNIFNMGDGAFSTANNAITAIGDAGGVVKHHLVASALEGFYSDHCKDAHSLMYAVEDCGSKTAKTSNIVVDGENEATSVQLTYATQGEGTRSDLDRQI
jgi:hypothetical protein